MLTRPRLNKPSERGALLIEALISLLLVTIATAAVASAVAHISRSGHHISNQLRPTCISPACQDDGISISCACGSHRWSVVR